MKLAFVGDGNNMAHSLMIGCSKLGMDVAIASPDGYKPNPIYTAWAVENAAASGSKVTVCTDPLEACKDADVLYTDVWASMGQECEAEKRKQAFAGYQINANCLKVAHEDSIFLHCLPGTSWRRSNGRSDRRQSQRYFRRSGKSFACPESRHGAAHGRRTRIISA